MRADVGRSAKPDPRKPLDLPMSKIDFSHLRHFIAQFDKAVAEFRHRQFTIRPHMTCFMTECECTSMIVFPLPTELTQAFSAMAQRG
jgi:hypothetical protein